LGRKRKPSGARRGSRGRTGDSLGDVMRAYEAGDPGRALAICRRIAERDCDDADALHLLGLLEHEAGRSGRAAERIRAAIALAPGDATYHFNLAEVERARGRPDDALASYDAALEIDPELADAHLGRGNALYDAGRFEEAAEALARAAALAPGDAEIANNHGNALAGLGRLDEAMERYRCAVALRPDYVEALVNLGNAQYQAGWLEEAARTLARAAELDPSLAQAHYRLGATLLALERFEDAEACFTRALEREPGHARARLYVGSCIERGGRIDEAMRIYEQVLAEHPDLAEAHFKVGSVLQVRGRFDEAVERLREAVARRPDLGDAHLQLVMNRRFRPDADYESGLEALLADPSLAEDAAASVHFALARILDARGDHDGAFEHYRAGNAIRARRLPFDADRFLHYLGRLTEVFDRAFFDRRRGFGSDSELPVFIVGMPRSGSTLVEQIVASHPRALAGGERHDMSALAKRGRALVGSDVPFPDWVPDLRPDQSSLLASEYLAAVTPADGDASRATDKLLGNFLRLGLIALLCPRARVIHCRRNPLDTGLSCFTQSFAHGWRFTYDLDRFVVAWREYERLMSHWESVLPLPMLSVDYEDVVADMEGNARRMIDFLGLEWDPRCLEFHRQQGEVRTASFWQVRQPLYATSVGRWRHYEKHLGPLLAAFGSAAS